MKQDSVSVQETEGVTTVIAGFSNFVLLSFLSLLFYPPPLPLSLPPSRDSSMIDKKSNIRH